MGKDRIDLNDFTILVESSNSNKLSTDSCFFDEPVIAIAFNGSGNVDLAVNMKANKKNHYIKEGIGAFILCR